ncbi:MAG: hypothetical protein NDJ18_10780 [candidate division Zixibacteria bacterium]|nr:hypothetical protein [candidate division Zixibacteria bacterium]
MIYLYKVIAFLIYFGAFVVGRGKAGKDALWAGRLNTDSLPSADIWLHAASVGEVRVIGHLIDYLHDQAPAIRFHLTVMTRAGYKTATMINGESTTVSYLPIDVPHLWARVLRQISPRIVVIAETEIWPNMLIALQSQGIPVVLVNGRLSEKAFGRYFALKELFKPLLAGYDHLFVKAKEDHGRFAQMGVLESQMTLAGDMKFDAPLIEAGAEKRQATRRSLGVDDADFLLVAGSTREGEEKQLVEILLSLSGRFPRLRMVLVPRHIERAGEILEIIHQTGHAARLFEEQMDIPGNSIIVVDKMGILIDLYAAADIAFVGGTLADVGGHNLLEPVWAGTPVLFGPSVANVQDAAEYILKHDFGTMTDSVDTLSATLEAILSGKRTFARKTRTDLAHSATATAGNYILKRIRHA